MKFEEALAQLREGKKIKHPSFPNDEYLMGCYITIPKDIFDEEIEKKISIVRMIKDKVHPHMKGSKSIFPNCENHDLHQYPQLNLLTIMCDDWEIIE